MLSKMDEFISTTEAAKMLGISRVALFNKIKSGEIEAKKVGRNYIIPREVILQFTKKGSISGKNKNDLDEGVDKVIHEYGETLKLLKDA